MGPAIVLVDRPIAARSLRSIFVLKCYEARLGLVFSRMARRQKAYDLPQAKLQRARHVLG